LTQPGYVKQYLYDAELVTDWCVGSPVIFRGGFAGQPWQDKGPALKWEPPTRSAYSYYSGTCGLDDQPETDATATYELCAEGGGTVLAVRQQGYASETSQISSAAGWDNILTQIKLLAEAKR